MKFLIIDSDCIRWTAQCPLPVKWWRKLEFTILNVSLVSPPLILCAPMNSSVHSRLVYPLWSHFKSKSLLFIKIDSGIRPNHCELPRHWWSCWCDHHPSYFSMPTWCLFPCWSAESSHWAYPGNFSIIFSSQKSNTDMDFRKLVLKWSRPRLVQDLPLCQWPWLEPVSLSLWSALWMEKKESLNALTFAQRRRKPNTSLLHFFWA